MKLLNIKQLGQFVEGDILNKYQMLKNYKLW